MLQPGSPAPDFVFKDAAGSLRHASELAGRPYLVYFYPKDDTPGCTKEACGFRDVFPQAESLGLTVIGVSADSDASHDKFRKKYNLPFALAADTDKRIAKAFGAWGPKSFMGKSYEGIHRVSFLVGPDGRIVKVYPKVKPEEHAAEVLADAGALSS
jgi:thioredoxin-dependent peroxiredoxin